ncbi:MAG: MOSC domain-containing protein [Gemmobacter sp.]
MTHAPANPVTAAELDAALPAILAAPHNAGVVRLLCTRPKPNARAFPEVLTLTRAVGVAGDYHPSQPWLTLPDGRPDPRIEVSIMPWRVLDLVWRDRDRVAHPGDNIAVDMTLSETDLPAGTRLAVGTAILRVSDVPNDGCVKWKVRCGRAAYDWIVTPEHLRLRLRGLYALIEQDGQVRLGDTIRRL